MSPPLLAIREVSKTFPGLKALDRVSLEVDSGSVVAVVGQNGSGKSTLVKILAGVYQADPGGEIRVGSNDGSEPGEHPGVDLHFIHQDLALVPTLSTVENLDLRRPLARKDWLPVSRDEERRHAYRLIREFGGDFDVEVPVAKLSAAERTIVAIAGALDGWDRPDNVLVLDEPTAALHGAEVEILFEAVRRVADRGAGVLFISHRLDEVMFLADHVVALRDGRVAASARRGQFGHDELVRMIAGRDVLAGSASAGFTHGEPVLSVTNLTGARLRGLDLQIHRGEIVGVAGILGSGREELAGLVFGAKPKTDGRVAIGGEELLGATPRQAIKRGAAYVPADRRSHGAIMTMRARENLTLPRLGSFRRRDGSLDMRAERREADVWVERVGLRPPHPERPLQNFSGGNQQKFVLAKWLRNKPRVLLLDEPTQGVDVGAKDAIYELIIEAARGGAGVLVSSSETKELVTLCDRVLVLRDGVCVAELDRSAISEARIIRESLGVSGEDLAHLGVEHPEESDD
jgi:ABC-type sugar transport system ATPase subunit